MSPRAINVPSTLSRIETGQAPARTAYLTILLDARLTGSDSRLELADLPYVVQLLILGG
jgi:hypothetical protein